MQKLSNENFNYILQNINRVDIEKYSEWDYDDNNNVVGKTKIDNFHVYLDKSDDHLKFDIDISENFVTLQTEKNVVLKSIDIDEEDFQASDEQAEEIEKFIISCI